MRLILLLLLIGLSVSTFAIKPEREYTRKPDQFGLKYSEYQVRTTDNYSINVWEYSLSDSSKTDKTIIMVGPDAGNMSYFILQAWAFREKGIRVISFDYRGFGKSSDFTINKDLLYHPEFAVDLDTVIKATRDKYPHDKLGLYALSMGTYISLIRKEKIEFVIAEGFYQDPQLVIGRIKVNRNRVVELPPRTRTISRLKPRVPIFIFCASTDKTTTTSDAREFARRNKVTLVEFEGDHLSGFVTMTKSTAGDEYMARVVDFLNQNGL